MRLRDPNCEGRCHWTDDVCKVQCCNGCQCATDPDPIDPTAGDDWPETDDLPDPETAQRDAEELAAIERGPVVETEQ